MKKKEKEKEKEITAEEKAGEEKTEEARETTLAAEQVQQLQSRIEQLQKEKDELLGKLQRVSAEFANFQKRTAKQVSDTILYEKENIIRTLLPALDNFEHTLQNAHCAETVDVLFRGIKIIYDQILEILKSHGVEQIKAVGEKFDPSMHEAMMRKSEQDKEPDIVLEEFQKGYKLNNRVIRPSKVVVNKLPSEEPAKPPTTEAETARQPQNQDSQAQPEQPDEENKEKE